MLKKSKTSVIGSRNKLNRVDYSMAPVINGGPIKFTDKYKYLGGSLDKEMTLSSLLSDTKRSALNKLSSLRKLRYCIN